MATFSAWISPFFPDFRQFIVSGRGKFGLRPTNRMRSVCTGGGGIGGSSFRRPAARQHMRHHLSPGREAAIPRLFADIDTVSNTKPLPAAASESVTTGWSAESQQLSPKDDCCLAMAPTAALPLPLPTRMCRRCRQQRDRRGYWRSGTYRRATRGSTS